MQRISQFNLHRITIHIIAAYVSISLCMYVCIYLSISEYMYICMYVCIYLSISEYMYVCMYVCMYLSIYLFRSDLLIYLTLIYLYIYPSIYVSPSINQSV